MPQGTKVVGIVLARAGSKGLPGKNMLPLGGRSLIEIAVASALEARLVDRVLFSTEDEGYANVAQQAGAEAPFLRPPALATDTASTWDVIRHAAAWLELEDGWTPDILVVLQPNTPFRRGSHIDATIEPILSGVAKSAMTVREVDYPPEWMFHLDAEGRMSPLLPGTAKLSRRQDARPTFQPNGLVYALRRELLANQPPMPDADTRAIVMDFADSINIDGQWHYDLTRVFWDRRREGAG